MTRRARVVTKSQVGATFGNDNLGFVRVRKRKLKGGHPHALYGKGPLASASFDLVKAVRIDGKPRHVFVLGLGSLKQPTHRESERMWFWVRAVQSMRRHGLNDEQCRRLLADCVRKGAPKPTAKECRWFTRGWPYMSKHSLDLTALLGYRVTATERAEGKRAVAEAHKRWERAGLPT